MTTKNLIVFAVAAIVLGGAAYVLNNGGKSSVPRLNGKEIFPKLALSDVAKVTFGDKLKLESGKDGWTVASYHGYPADAAKLKENLLKLAELKVGQVARGVKVEKPETLLLADAKGGEIARLEVGPKHEKWGRGRYAAFDGETVLVTDTLDAFDGDGKAFVETKIVDTPWISFNDIVENADPATLGFATGIVANVTIAGDTNRTVTVGNVVKGGSDRYLKLDNSKWVYTVPGYSVESLLPKPPKADEKKSAPKAVEKPAKKAKD